jgi:trans-aconitate methyltransferase
MIYLMGTDTDWNQWGQRDPYYGVLTYDKFRMAQLTEEALKEFFQSGRDQVDYLLKKIGDHIDKSYSPKRVVDFGCGTGRLLIAFADVADCVLGMDVSDGMLAEAAKNCRKFNLNNVSLAKSDDDLTQLTGKFDLIHSFIVFQHIPPTRGIRLFKKLLEHLDDGGVGAIQVTYSHETEPYTLLRAFLRRMRAIAGPVKRAVIGHFRNRDPVMQMNFYSLNQILEGIQRAGIGTVFTEFTNHDGHYGVYIFFQKPKDL